MDSDIKHPGVMLYFDTLRPAVEAMSLSDCGALLKAIMDYSQFGAVPDDLGAMPKLVFDMYAPKIDRDIEQYRSKIWASRYAVYCRECKKIDEEPKSLSWFIKQWAVEHALSADVERNLDIPGTEAETSTGTGNSKSTPSGETAGAGGGGVKGFQGGLEGEPVNDGPAISFPLPDGSEFPVSQDFVRQMQERYPNLDVVSILREMKPWFSRNPDLVKSKSDIVRHIISQFEKRNCSVST